MNRYTIFAVIIILMVAIFITFGLDDDEIEKTGYAKDIHQTDSGYTFILCETDGTETRSFTDQRIDESLHIFKGSFSSDGRMFFIHEID